MTVSNRLKTLRGDRVIPIYRKTGPRMQGADAFTRDLDTEIVMDALPYIIDVVRAAEEAGLDTELKRLDDFLTRRS